MVQASLTDCLSATFLIPIQFHQWVSRKQYIPSTIIYTLSAAFTLGTVFGAYGVFTVDNIRAIMLLLTVWVYYSFKTKKIKPSPDDYLALPDSFNLYPGNVISLDIRNSEDKAIVSEQIHLFCKGHKINSKTGMKVALCFEELAVNIIRFPTSENVTN